MLEYEKKIMISENEYRDIIDMIGKKITVSTQSNYYFDTTDNLMNKRGITFRIRSKDGKYIATIKNHNCDNVDCSIEENISERTEFDPKSFDAFGLQYKGVLLTERIVIFKDLNCEMVLDRNVYLGHVDFELEVEYSNGNEAKAMLLLNSIAETLVVMEKLDNVNSFLKRINANEYKSRRFFARLEGKSEC